MDRVVVSGYYGWGNIGDDAILQHITDMLKSNGLMPVVICNNPSMVKERFEVEVVERTDFKGILSEIKAAKAFISGGGSLIQDATSKKSAIYYLMTLMMANQFLPGKSFVYGQGLGPINSKIVKNVTRYVFNKVAKIYVRDEESKELLKSLKVKKEISLMIDPVLSSKYEGELDLNFTEDERKILEKNPIVISLKNNEADYQMKAMFSNTLKALKEDGVPVVLIPFHHSQDIQISKEIAERYNNAYVFERKLSLDEVKYIMEKSEMVVGMRLHALIMAASLNTPFIPISYDPKIDSFSKMMEIEVVFDTNHFDTSRLLYRIKKLQEDYFFHKEKLEAKTASLKKINEKIDEEIIRLIKG